jgi:hypothetical protein
MGGLGSVLLFIRHQNKADPAAGQENYSPLVRLLPAQIKNAFA